MEFSKTSKQYSNRNSKTLTKIKTNPKIFTFEDFQKEAKPLIDITQNLNMIPDSSGQILYSPDELIKKKHRFSTTARSKDITSNKTQRYRYLSRMNSQLNGIRDFNLKNPFNISMKRKLSPITRSIKSSKNCSFMLPNSYEIIADHRKAIMKEYYHKKKEINKKYDTMIYSLREEEFYETKWVLANHKESEVPAKLNETRENYAMTTNLLQQQKLVSCFSSTCFMLFMCVFFVGVFFAMFVFEFNKVDQLLPTLLTKV